ncbi:ABC transporter substrate-binding protein [Alkalinema pantanalense CENA528]|uniref:ABC transporter substrate-binding protein n=1 Tax=Alkalinema pantanalense TaxID=1620705 RepID=UPI003D6EFBC6
MTTNTTPKKSLPPIIYLGTLLLLFAGFSLGRQYIGNPLASDTVHSTHLDDRLSHGSHAFFPEDGTWDKSQAIASYASSDFSTAQGLFDRSLKQKPNDPESVIYRNNAKAYWSKPLSIAVSIPISSDANGSREILRGVAQAQTEINASGGINGSPLFVNIVNDDNDVKIAQQVAHTLVDRQDILGVVGHYASNITLATADIYHKGKLVAISPISSTVNLSYKSPYIFRTVPSDSISARALTDYMLQTLKSKKAVVYFNAQSDYSKSLTGELHNAIEQAGGQVVTEYDLANSSFSPHRSLEEAKQRGAEVILLASNTGSLDRALQVVQANNNPLPVLGGDDVYSPKTLDVTRASGQGMVVAVPWHILGRGSQNFATRSRKLWGGDVNWRTVTAYDATQALSAALQQSPTRKGVQQALTSPSFTVAGASRTISFLPSGDRNVPVQLVKIVAGDRSTYGYDFTPIP